MSKTEIKCDCNPAFALGIIVGLTLGIVLSAMIEIDEQKFPGDQSRKDAIMDCAKRSSINKCIKTEKYLFENKSTIKLINVGKQ